VPDKEADFTELTRRGAIEQHLSYSPGQRELQAQFTVFEPIWQCWLRSAVFVQGQLFKQHTIGGTVVDFPVCDATVEIYEVDPLHIIIPKLPILVVDRLRDLIANGRIPGGITRVPERVPQGLRVIPKPGPDPLPLSVMGARLRSVGGTSRATTLAAQSHTLSADSSATLTKLTESTELRYLAQVGSTLQFQQALIQNPVLIRPLLCWLYPHFVTMQRVGTATTDRCGHFRTVFFQGCHNHDTPDLYFKATQRLFGVFTATIYAPTPIACHTWWDYVSGTEVKLYTHSPLAHTCAPCPPVQGPNGSARWVAFLAIGGQALSTIYGTSKFLHDTASADEQTAMRGLTTGGSPFGGLLRPRLVFANELESLGVRYYRVSWHRGTNPLAPFEPLHGGVQHYYRHDVSTPDGVFPAWTPYTLGPAPVAGAGGTAVPDLTKVPYPSLVASLGGVWDTPPGGGDVIEHLSSAKFPTTELAPGLRFNDDGTTVAGTSDESGFYQLKVDLYDANGVMIDIHALGIKFVVPNVATLTGTIPTTDAEPLGLVVGSSMVITLRVDNNACLAQLPTPALDGVSADECCGVMTRTAAGAGDVVMPYRAYHPHGFASYSFTTVRGAQKIVDLSGPVDDPGTPAVEDPHGGVQVTRSVDMLMSTDLPPACMGHACVVAGFAETLDVWATATDGWGSYLGLGDRAVRAFVLSTVTLPTS
jgi:hypothetical protein